MKIKKIASVLVVIVTMMVVAGCSSEELTIQISSGNDTFSLIDADGNKIPGFGGPANSTKGLKINGKNVYSATVMDMAGAHGRKGVYFAFSAEQAPVKTQGTDASGRSFTRTSYNGGTMLAAGNKLPYKKDENSLDITIK